MDNIACVKLPAFQRKEKKKQGKDELDRMKQAEKKRRRLEKALATSAAIITELEKKKQIKKEEQQRLDEEGARIAEAVALNVLGDDTDDSHQIVFNRLRGFDYNPRGRKNNINIFMGGWSAEPTNHSLAKYSVNGLGFVSDHYGPACKWNDHKNGWPLSCGMLGRDFQTSFLDGRGHVAEMSAGPIAAQAVSSLRIAEDLASKINLCKEI